MFQPKVRPYQLQMRDPLHLQLAERARLRAARLNPQRRTPGNKQRSTGTRAHSGRAGHKGDESRFWGFGFGFSRASVNCGKAQTGLNVGERRAEESPGE